MGKVFGLIGLVWLCTLRTAMAVDVYIVAGQSNGWRISSLAPYKVSNTAGVVCYIGMKCVSKPDKGRYQKLNGVRGMGAGLAAKLSKVSKGDIVFIQYCRCGAGTWYKTRAGWYPGDDPQTGKVYVAGLYGSFKKYIAHARGIVENDLKLK